MPEDRGGALDLAGFAGLAEELTIETSEGRRNFLLVSRSGRHIKVAPGAYELLKGLRAGRSCESMAEEFSRKGPRPVSASEIECACRRVVESLTEIVGRAPASELPAGFWFRLRLLPGTLVARLARFLSPAFHPAAAVGLLVFILVSFTPLLRQGLSLRYASGDVWVGYLLFVLSLLAHELGHASACARYGAEPSDIGFAFYLIYPALYSDVTAAWRLRRWQRVVVDLGGTLFQFAAAGVGAAAYQIWGWEPLRAAFVMIWFGALFSLNPIFKFDGYWMLADALGVTDLSRQPLRLAAHALTRVRRQETEPLPWPPWMVLLLSLYAAVACAVWGYFLWRLLPVLAGMTIGLPQALGTSFRAFRQGAPPSVLRGQIGGLLATVFLLFIFWSGTFRLLESLLIKPLRSRRSSPAGSTRAQTLPG